MNKFDKWLATQPDNDIWLVEKPDYAELQANHEFYPFDEWTCRDCNTGVGFWLFGDNGATWTNYWLLETEDEMICEECMATLVAEA